MKKDENKRSARNKLDSTTITGIVTLAIVICAMASGFIMWANVYLWGDGAPREVTASTGPNPDPYYQGSALVGGGANID